MPEFDGPWKEFLATLFKHALRWYRPEEAKQVNWPRGAESLDSEMQKLLPESVTGVKRVDRFVKVWLHTGDARHYHMEVQCWKEDAFEHRVCVYNNVAEILCGDPV